jgi:hypothetical protein
MTFTVSIGPASRYQTVSADRVDGISQDWWFAEINLRGTTALSEGLALTLNDLYGINRVGLTVSDGIC